MKKSILILALIALLPVQSALAFAPWGFPPSGKYYQPMNATEVFLAYEDGSQTVVIKPEWRGDASKFGMVYPTPSKPTVEAGPADLFWQLDEATNPYIQQPPIYYAEDTVKAATAERDVEVVEEKQVAEYTVTVLRATSASALTTWLKRNNYNYTKSDSATMKYYIDQGNFYFVALKVDATDFEVPIYRIMEDKDASVSSDGATSASSAGTDDAKMAIMPPNWWWGELSPIKISFPTNEPQLPMRTLKSLEEGEMTFDLYTLGSKAIYIPGVDTVWSNLVDSAFMKSVPSLSTFNAKARWLVRQEVKFIPNNIKEDVELTLAETEDFTTVSAGTQVRFNPAQFGDKTGIVVGTRGQVVNTDGSGNAYTFTRNLTIGSTGEDVRELQKILNAEGFTIAKTGPGSPGNESTYFGLLTKQALIKYQNFYRSELGITAGTGYFGPATMKFVNR